MRRILIVFFATLLAANLQASPVDRQKAKTVADNFWQSMKGSKSGDTLSECSTEWPFDALYLFTAGDGGFVIVSADDIAAPIIGYSLSSLFAPASMPLALQEWLGTYQAQLSSMQNVAATPRSEVAAQWNALLDGRGLPQAKDGKSLAPLIKTHWDQTSPYNRYCPSGTPVGCAATAQSQLMKYWNFPPFGYGGHSYESPGYGVQYAHFGKTPFLWDQMPLQLNDNSPEAAIDAVASLCYQVGVSVEMMYGPAGMGGSGAFGLLGEYMDSASVDHSLRDFFFYSPDMYILIRDHDVVGDEAWIDTLIAELDRRHPIIYEGSSSTSGHGFICDGYDAMRMMHFNFGWSGNGDGYYSINNICPVEGGVGGGGLNFSQGNVALFGAVPDYGIAIGESSMTFYADQAVDSILFALTDSAASGWNYTSSAPWVSVDTNGVGVMGWIRIIVDENASGQEREATITFSCGQQQRTVAIRQLQFLEDSYCNLQVEMTSSGYPGWTGDSHLSFESLDGEVYGTARLQHGFQGTAQVRVPPETLRVVWHGGGNNDRYVGFVVKNADGNILLQVDNAAQWAGETTIQNPCGNAGLQCVESDATAVYPNPSSGDFHLSAQHLVQADVFDIFGHLHYSTSGTVIPDSALQRGVYIVRIITGNDISVHKIVKQ